MKATTLHRQKRSDVAVTSITRRPRAIVVILGEKLDHYTDLYHSLQCSTVSVETIQPQHVVSELAVSVSRETARLVRMAQLSEMGMGNVPVMIHVMGSSGGSLVEELEKQVRLVLGDDVPYLPPRSSTKTFNMNASTRSLFTTETDPMSSDDEDDESSHECIIETSPLSARPVLQRLSPQPVRRRPRAMPSVHRIDMERTGVTLQHASNPEDRAYRRDLELFCSHLSMMLWDMPPPSQGWTMLKAVARIFMFLVFLWNCIQQWLFGCSSQGAIPQELAGLSLARQHALMYVDDRDESVKCLLRETSLIMDRKLNGSRKQHGAEYVAFVQQALDRISSQPTEDDEDEGWSSDEE